ncbi:hypothetical protein F2Q69_00055799 [Brassica cretica]|uniref:Cytochrome P450 n=1 Tax=Brassica cretica TaxID=69181 RepID=A0A8S9N0A9_BRACR|nr:hypothetical protein F2Q69_00055799 [Brassica cretica]
MEISLLCLFLVTFTSLIFVGKKIKRSKWNLPPSPPEFPIIGSLHQVGELPHRSVQRLAERAGHVMLVHLGFIPVTVISSKEAAEEVLKTHDLDCCSRPKLVGTMLISRGFKDIGFTPYSEEWKERRKFLVREFLCFKKVQSFGYIREEECNLLVKKLSESALDQSPVDLSKTLFWLTARQHKRLHDVFFKLDALFQRVIDDHMHPGRSKDQRDITDLLLDVMHKQGKDDSLQLTLDHIKNIFIAGIDTGVLTMIWAMTELARNPKVMKKLQVHIRSDKTTRQHTRESNLPILLCCVFGWAWVFTLSKASVFGSLVLTIRDHFGNNKERITEEDIGKVPYLNLVIKDTFRLHPAVPLLLPRETMAHIKVQGYDIPPKRRILINAWAIARDPKLWTNPEEFIPERFIDSPVDYRGQHFELLPFGSGRRMCPGMTMGIAPVELGLLNLLYFFDWKLPDGMTQRDIDVEEGGTLTIVKKVPLKLVPVSVH